MDVVADSTRQLRVEAFAMNGNEPTPASLLFHVCIGSGTGLAPQGRKSAKVSALWIQSWMMECAASCLTKDTSAVQTVFSLMRK